MKRVLFLLLITVFVLQSCISDTASTPTPNATAISTTAATGTALPAATPTPVPDVRDVVPIPPQRDLFELTQRLRLKSNAPIPKTAPSGHTDLPVGARETIQLIDLSKNKPFTIQAALRHKTPNAYFWFDEKISASLEDVEKAARDFENVILPTVRRYFGDFWNPGVDGDPHLYIVHANIPAVAGYFSGLDEYPQVVNRLSNQHETIYINVGHLKVGSREYLNTLAHELQHAVEFTANPYAEIWVNEGLSELSSDLAGYPPVLVQTFLVNADTQLNTWSDEPSRTPAHYGASFLFMKYMFGRYGGYEGVKELFKIQKPGVYQVEDYLRKFNVSFDDVFADWVVTNIANSGAGGRYGYQNYAQRIRSGIVKVDAPAERTNQRASQYAARYYQIDPQDSDFTLKFDGSDTVRIVPTDAHSGASFWWGNRGDGIDSTLTREFDLTNVRKATLSYWVWHDLEKDFDFAYVEVSKDGGRTWDIVKGTSTTAESPLDNNYGHGYNGNSGGGDEPKWINETADLSAYAGSKVLVRFEYTTDEALNTDGFAVDDISIPEIAFADDAESDGKWTAEGFLRTSNKVKQTFIVQLVHRDNQGLPLKVERVALDSNNIGEITTSVALVGYEDTMLIVSGSTRITTEKATFSFSVSE